jgi:hypothetical protein
VPRVALMRYKYFLSRISRTRCFDYTIFVLGAPTLNDYSSGSSHAKRLKFWELPRCNQFFFITREVSVQAENRVAQVEDPFHLLFQLTNARQREHRPPWRRHRRSHRIDGDGGGSGAGAGDGGDGGGGGGDGGSTSGAHQRREGGQCILVLQDDVPLTGSKANAASLHVMVDLKGMHSHWSQQLLQYRTALVQMSAAGFLGSSGASTVDYLLGDILGTSVCYTYVCYTRVYSLCELHTSALCVKSHTETLYVTHTHTHICDTHL